MFKLFFSRQTAPAAEPVMEDTFVSEDFIIAEPVMEDTFVSEDFIIADYEDKTITDLLAQLRERTYNFVYENRLISGTTEFFYGDLPIYVSLNEDWNVLYTVNRYTTTSPKDAAAIIADVIQF